jgi:hypothetical protein
MCDRIKEDDERMKDVRNLKCSDINKHLETCLKINERDFRKCKNELNMLKECMAGNKTNIEKQSMNSNV